VIRSCRQIKLHHRRPHQALEMFRKCLAMFAEVGARQDETRILAEMCHSIFALCNDAEAERGWHEVLRVTA